jgi:hypothetical protein
MACGMCTAPREADEIGRGDGAKDGCEGVATIAGGPGEERPGTWPEEERRSVLYNGWEFWPGGSMILEIAGDALAR